MQTLKKGSRGDDVKRLQQLLGMTNCDGIFGAGTEATLVAYQATHTDANGKPLAPDGICGDKTWAALLAKAGDKPTINYQPIKVHITPKGGRIIKFIAVHYTESSSSTKGKALATRKVFLDREASADFVVDDEEIVQINPDLRNYYCWSVGGSKYNGNGGASLFGVATNSNTISVEVCSTHVKGTTFDKSNHSGWGMTDAALSKAAALIRYLMREFGIPASRVIRHYDVNGKLCPGVIGWNDGPMYDTAGREIKGKRNESSKWETFKKRLQ